MAERVLSEVVDLDIDKCQNVYGVSPCTAGRVESGTAQAGAATTLTLRAGASAVNDAYNGMTARLTGGAGSVQERRISDYVGASKVATLESRWRTNRLTFSEQFDNGIWQKNNASITANQYTAPDGTLTADKMTVTGGGFHLRYQTAIAKDGSTWVGSIYIRQVNGTPANASIDLNDAGAAAHTLSSEWQRISQIVVPGAALTNVFMDVDVTQNGDYAVWGAQLEKASDLGDYIAVTSAQIVLPDATTTYDIIDRPNACYNTYRTCQDKPNYVKGTQTTIFTGVGAPLNKAAPARPYISRISTAPTEIDPEQGTARRAQSSITMIDAPDTDVEMDPYVRDRATAAAGTFWRRFFARNLNYGGRVARVKRGFVDAAGVFGTYTTERFIIESAKGPAANGDVVWTLKDPVKLLDRSKAPTPTSGKLAVALTVNDLQLTLGSGEGAQYEASGWVRIGDEVIRYSGLAGDVLSWPDGTYRGQFGTEALAAAVDDGVQQCLVYLDSTFSAVIEDLHNRAGIVDADLDLAQLASEEGIWLGDDFHIYNACITDPEDISALVQEMLQPAGMASWWSPTEQKVKFKVIAPASPAAVSVTVLDDAGELVEDSVAIERLETLRITMAAMNFGLRRSIDNVDEAKNYRQGEVAIDADAESANEYNERRPITLFSRFYGPQNLPGMRIFVQRYVARHRDAPERIEFTLDPKDGALVEGDIADLQTYRLVDEAGAIRTARILVIRREPGGTQDKYAGRITNFDRPYGFIAPNGTPNYPANNGYACISQDNGLMTNGDPGYLII
jgi:hypothetical protein